MASLVSVDVSGFSVSYNEYLKLISIKRRAEPDQDTLMEVFRSLDNMYIYIVSPHFILDIIYFTHFQCKSPSSIANILSFRIFDPHNTGTIDEEQFRKIMKSKQGIPEEDVEEMIDGNKQIIIKVHIFKYNRLAEIISLIESAE